MFPYCFQGDSGGPLNCKGRDGKWYLQGVSSFVSGKGCNTPMKPSVFTRVASFIPWIKEVSVGRLESMLYCIIADKQGITWQYHYVQIYDNPLVFLLLDHGQQLRIDYSYPQ